MPEQPDNHSEEGDESRPKEPRTGGAERWERVGRQLLAEDLEVMGRSTLQEAFVNAKRRVETGEELTKDDVEEMRLALDEASKLVRVAAEASPETEPSPDPWNFLDEEGREEYARAASLSGSEESEERGQRR